ncbi:MAG: hypothetical protein WC626_01710 [Methanoregula sp.]
MKNSQWIVLIIALMLFFSGCTSQNKNQNITVSNIDPDGFQQNIVGDFEIYTGTYLVTNPTNSTFDNVDVDITLIPATTYCHELKKTFKIPRFFPHENKTVEISTGEFANLNCQYDYTYQVFS